MLITHTIGNGWRFKGADEQHWLPAQVPGCVHTDLLRNGKIEDPFYGTNEHRLQWIDKQDWEYETTFEADVSTLTASRVELVFDGLDTYAEVYLNGHNIISADNMFREWKAEVKRLLQPGPNLLQITFRSPIKEDLPKLEKLGYSLPAANDQSELGELGDRKVSVFARKAPFHYGWDWGPRFVTSGVWREVRLEAWTDYRITDLYIRQDDVTASQANLVAIVEIESEREQSGQLTIMSDRSGHEWKKSVGLSAGVNNVQVELSIDNPDLWWCRGLGEPNRYTFRADFRGDDGGASGLAATTGLRSVRLVREKDRYGTSFYVELNGVPVFAKGANHIPNDSFVTEITRERYRHEIASAAMANMNMLRVWGGGIYEQRDFYELCDEYGIMVWQDFMFACSMYPGDEDFLNNIREEAEYNVKRLRNHPCIALWCGNNEIDLAWSHYDDNAGWGGWKKEYEPELRARIWADYEAIFHRILPEAVAKQLNGIHYWPSSPMQELTGDASQHAHNESTRGDIHYWGVWHSVEPFENYNVKIGRFMSEYGFQSFPEYKSVRTYAEESDMALESEVMLAHQKNGAGNRLIKQYMEMYLKEPKDFPSFLYLSQILQAEAMKTAIEAHRRRKGFCMGTLYWQMNDCWPVASWAGIDSYGRWKAMHYYAKRSFSDVLVSVDGTGDDAVNVHVVTDLLERMDGQLHVTLLDFSGNVLREERHVVTVEANAAASVLTLSSKEWLAGSKRNEVLLMVSLETAGRLAGSSIHYFAASKEIELSQPHIAVTEAAGSGGSRFTLETDTLAKDVWLSSEKEGVFSDNFFDLLPGKPVTVQFLGRHAEGDKPFAPASPGQVNIRSMVDFLTT